MDIIKEFASQLFWQLTPMMDWALKNWALTLAVLAALVYWTGRNSGTKTHF